MGDFHSYDLEVLGRIERTVVLSCGPFAFLLSDDGDLRLLALDAGELVVAGPIAGRHGLLRTLTMQVELGHDPFVGSKRKLRRPTVAGTRRSECRCEPGVEALLQQFGFLDAPSDELLQVVSR